MDYYTHLLSLLRRMTPEARQSVMDFAAFLSSQQQSQRDEEEGLSEQDQASAQSE